MTRSRRRNPIFPVTTAVSDKRDKTLAHRAERAAVRAARTSEADEPHHKQFGDPWKADKDGKSYDADAPSEYMRK